MIPTTLIVGATAQDRERTIAGLIRRHHEAPHCAVLLEGLSGGTPILESLPHVTVTRIAPGCVCCSNQMVMRTYLHRLIRQQPDHLYLSLADHTHLNNVRNALQRDGYENVLTLSEVLQLGTHQ